MKNDLENILPERNKDIDNQKLMDYLSGHLTIPEREALEDKMAGDEFLHDAVEGLQKITDPKDLQAYVDQLNTGLRKQTAKNLKRKEKRRLKDQPYTYLTILIILLLTVLCYIVIRKYAEARSAAKIHTSTLAKTAPIQMIL